MIAASAAFGSVPELKWNRSKLYDNLMMFVFKLYLLMLVTFIILWACLLSQRMNMWVLLLLLLLFYYICSYSISLSLYLSLSLICFMLIIFTIFIILVIMIALKLLVSLKIITDLFKHSLLQTDSLYFSSFSPFISNYLWLYQFILAFIIVFKILLTLEVEITIIIGS